MVALGWAAARRRLVGTEGLAAFASYAFNLALPALVASLLSRQPLAQAFDARFFAALLGAGVLIAALPTAANVWVFADRFDAAPERVSAGILVSTVAAVVTFPLVASLVLP